MIVRRVMMLLFCILLLNAGLRAEAPGTLQEFFQNLVRNYGVSGLPNADDLSSIEDHVAGMPAEDIREAMPAIVAALEYPNESVQSYAASAVFVISRRSDSSDLLKPYIGAIMGLFRTGSARLCSLAGMTIVGMKPSPPPEVVPALLSLIGRRDLDNAAQVSALAAVVRVAPDNPEAVSAVVRFMSRPLDSNTRLTVLNAIRSSHLTDVRVRDAVIANLQQSEPGVKIAAINALSRMGPVAVGQAEPDLQKLLQHESESPDVKAAAKKALRQIGK